VFWLLVISLAVLAVMLVEALASLFNGLAQAKPALEPVMGCQLLWHTVKTAQLNALTVSWPAEAPPTSGGKSS
jgi:hypothetical protein